MYKRQLFFLLTLDITNRTGDGLIATVCIWLALPLTFIAMVWWIYACVRDTVRLLRDGVAPEDAPTWAEYAVWWVQDELAEIAVLDGRGRWRKAGRIRGARGIGFRWRRGGLSSDAGRRWPICWARRMRAASPLRRTRPTR